MTEGVAAGAPREAGGGAASDAGELDALLDHLFVRTGHDFRGYARRALQRRVDHLLLQEGLASVSALRARVAAGDARQAARFAERLCVKVSTLFRDPEVWAALRAQAVPLLRDLPFVRAWSAGCSTGEEAYSLAILLREAGLGGRVRIYATDVDETALAQARAGTFPLRDVPEFTRNYVRGGGAASLSEYYSAGAEAVSFHPALRKGIVFATHNLVTDASFNEFHLVLCRNVLMYFGPAVQQQAQAVLSASLAPGGVLGVGLREVVPPQGGEYEVIDAALKLYRRRARAGAVTP